MFEITGDHISKLDDADLRLLIGRLCEAELRQYGLPLSSVTAGGHQDAPDGGIDVRVDAPIGSASLDFIPKRITGFQVKCTDMPVSKIDLEMRPKGVLRQSIRELTKSHGAYVIVSSKGSITASTLADRRNAMRAAVGELADGEEIHIDFYDSERLASWIRKYAGVGLWLRERIGDMISGWYGYGNWAYGDRDNSEYLLDEKGRIESKEPGNDEPLTVEQGVTAMRTELAQPGGVVRLIGLSGVGKTRLVQALFDNRVGDNPLDSAIVAYTDQGGGPNPSARDMLQRCGATGLRTIFVIDNCNPATHRDLTQIVRTFSSTLSLVTIEYDVADDEPEETRVFRLEPASDKILTEILERLMPNISQADRQVIVEFSGGNARIALALAKTVPLDGSLGSLNDLELFKRLFHQKQESGEVLMRAAEACSLVYSFDGESWDNDAAELPILAALADISTKEIYRQIEELRARDLVQRRGKWRAVLPHAIANRLARQALERIPSSLVTQGFAQKGRERILKSFSRRLGYLHDCDSARKIAEGWLNNGGILADPTHFNEIGLAIFDSIAPLAPSSVLLAIERSVFGEAGPQFLASDSSNRWRWTKLLRSLAYDPELFDRAVLLLAHFRATEIENNNSTTRDSFVELFHLYLSGTWAPAIQRLACIRKLLGEDDHRLRKCALEALNAMLEARHFRSSHDFTFGARSRGFGWEPNTQDELIAWFRSTFGLVRELVSPASLYREEIRSALAGHFRTLWAQRGLEGDLEALARELSAKDGWPDGWIAIRLTIRYDSNTMYPDSLRRLSLLEAELRPRDQMQRIYAYVLSQSYDHFDIAYSESEDDNDSSHQKASEQIAQVVEELGREAATTENILEDLLPIMLRTGHGQHWLFGRGLAMGASNLINLWRQFQLVLIGIPDNERNVSLMRGYLNAAYSRNRNVANQMLNEAVLDPILGSRFPVLQSSVNIDDAGVNRILSSLAARLAPVWIYENLGLGGVSDSVSAVAFKAIVLGVAEMPEGFPIATNLLNMRFYSIATEKRELDHETLALGRELLMRADFKRGNDNTAHRLDKIARKCLAGSETGEVARRLCINLNQALSDSRASAWHYRSLTETLFRLHPTIALDIFLIARKAGRYHSLSTLFTNDRDSPVNASPPEILLSWADGEPADRYPRLAREIKLSNAEDELKGLAWTPLALQVLERSPDREAVLDIFSERLQPTSWAGSLADALIPYVRLVQELKKNSNSLIATWASKQEEYLRHRIDEERKRDRRVDESFE